MTVPKTGDEVSPPMREEIPFCLSGRDVHLLPFGSTELQSSEYISWMNDPGVTRTLGRFDYLMPVPRSELARYFESIDRESTLFFAIYQGEAPQGSLPVKAMLRFIGTLKIYDINRLDRRAAIGIAIGDRTQWGKGYSTAAIGIACAYLFDTLGMRKVTAGFLASNVGMERSFLKNGFEIEAIFKEHIFVGGTYVDHKFVAKFGGHRGT